MEYSISYARERDAQDPLRAFRKRFLIPERSGKQQAYFLGNSLGLQPVTAKARIEEVLGQWQQYGVEGFFEGEKPWLQYHESLTPMLGKIVGAAPSEVVVMNQLSVNLHLLLFSFYRPNGKRNKILCEAKAFPSDQYILETQARHYGLNPDNVIVEVAPRPGSGTLDTADIVQAINEHKDELALVLFSGINYYTGQVFDMPAIVKAAHAVGAMAGFDLAHAAGNIPLHLHDWEADFACWCSYKYLNSGPGAVGGVFIHEKHHQQKSIPRLAGWWGYDAGTRFKMEKGFVPDAGANGWQLSTPSMLLYASHRASLELFEEAGIEQLQQKRQQLTAYLWFVMDAVQKRFGDSIVEVITPRSENEHGCQISLLMKKEGRRVYDALMEKGFMVDWREPDVIRLAPVPFYNTFAEVFSFGEALEEIFSTIK